eukprot:5103516-Pyramimonas_sp.AAC.1
MLHGASLRSLEREAARKAGIQEQRLCYDVVRNRLRSSKYTDKTGPYVVWFVRLSGRTIELRRQATRSPITVRSVDSRETLSSTVCGPARASLHYVKSW